MISFAKKKNEKNLLNKESWKVLIVDDEHEVHTITKSVLKKFEFDNRNLIFYSAYNSQEALDIIKRYSDISLVFLDVVMESDDAGLKVAKAIREDLKNNIIRIVLRTGQPGFAPEKDVIVNYDINDYKEKTELTSTKLFTTTISALRSYRDLLKIEASLEQIRERAFKTAILKNNLQKENTLTLKEKNKIIEDKNQEIELLKTRLKNVKETLINILQNHHEELNSDTVDRIRKQFPKFVAIEDIETINDILEQKDG